MEYKVIPTEFKKKGFTYRQLKRDKALAIFEQTRSGSSFKNYEVVKLGRHDGYHMGGVFIEPSETYPGSSLWGIMAWTCTDLHSALLKYRSLSNDGRDPIQLPPPSVEPLPIDPSKIVTVPVPAGP